MKLLRSGIWDYRKFDSMNLSSATLFKIVLLGSLDAYVTSCRTWSLCSDTWMDTHIVKNRQMQNLEYYCTNKWKDKEMWKLKYISFGYHTNFDNAFQQVQSLKKSPVCHVSIYIYISLWYSRKYQFRGYILGVLFKNRQERTFANAYLTTKFFWFKQIWSWALWAVLRLSIKRFTNSLRSHFMLNIKGSLPQVLKIHMFTSRGSGNPRVHRNPRNPS